MKALQLLCLPAKCQSWTVPTLLKQLVRLLATLVLHTRQLVARVEVAVVDGDRVDHGGAVVGLRGIGRDWAGRKRD